MSLRLLTERLTAIPIARAHVRDALAGRRWFLLVLLGLAVAWHIATLASLGTGFLNQLFNDSTRRIGQASDFFAVYQAGSDFLNNDLVYGAEGMVPSVPYAYPFRYLPSMAYTLGLAFNLFDPWDAYWGWLAFNELLLMVNIYLTWRFAPEPRLRFLGSVMWLAFTPLYLEFYMGQFSFLMATLFFWMGLGFAGRFRPVSSPSWAVSLVVKTNSLLFIPILMRMKWYGALLSGLTFAAVLNIPYFLLEEGSFDIWRGNFSGISGDQPTNFHAGALGFQNLLSVLVFLADERPGQVLDIIAQIADIPMWVPLIVALSLLATFAPGRFDPIAALAFWVAAYFLIYTDVWEHQYVMLLPVLILLVILRPRFANLALAVYIIIALPTPYWLLEQFADRSTPEVRDPWFSDPQHAWTSLQIVGYHLSKAAPTLVLWLVLVYDALRNATWPRLPRATTNPAD